MHGKMASKVPKRAPKSEGSEKETELWCRRNAGPVTVLRKVAENTRNRKCDMLSGAPDGESQNHKRPEHVARGAAWC